mmetsp:Transcript_83474/g.260670  ORF Transcript_83474/g.260670 Transcript_83474/m.260670 type:complete len:489 (+) Transcript_83474:81-1547(+)
MMRRTGVALSAKLRLSQHPRNALNWRDGRDGFYRAKNGASKMKWNYVLPYRRVVDSLFHYPEVSQVTGKPIDWYHGEPQDGYDGVRVFGEHTLELRGMPFGRTPEYVQERLRRFFSKFGPVKQCRAEPHPLDPYQCEGTAFVSFRDKKTALKALKAPLKFPASLHDKVVSMRHLDSDKCNDPDYREKSKFWDRELVGLARQLHEQLSTDPEFRQAGKRLDQIGLGLFENELVALPGANTDVVPRGRGGVPLPKGLHGAPTRLVPAGPAVRRRFGSWELFLAEPPLDLLFSIHRLPAAASSSAAASEGEASEAPAIADARAAETVVVLPRLVSKVQRSRILFKFRMALERRLHGEFSIWWREGKIPLPEYTQRRVDWLKHKPPLPWELQIQSRSMHRHRIFDERYLYKMQLVRARNAKRKEKRADWNETRKEMLDQREKSLKQRRERVLEAVGREKCAGLLGSFSSRLVAGGGRPPPGARAPSAESRSS